MTGSHRRAVGFSCRVPHHALSRGNGVTCSLAAFKKTFQIYIIDATPPTAQRYYGASIKQ